MAKLIVASVELSPRGAYGYKFRNDLPEKVTLTAESKIKLELLHMKPKPYKPLLLTCNMASYSAVGSKLERILSIVHQTLERYEARQCFPCRFGPP